MKFKETELLLDIVKKYIPTEKMSFNSEEKENYSRKYISDFITVLDDDENYLAFDVFDNEIIICFFSDHIHFADYTLDLSEGDPNYIKRACEFLEQLFTLPMERNYTLKGNKIICDETFFINGENKESCAGKTVYSCGIKNIFKKKIQVTETKKFDIEIGNFTKPIY